MWISVENCWTHLTRGTPDEERWLREYLSFKNPRARFTRARDDRVRLFNLASRTFPTGFLPLVQRAGAQAGFAVEVVDKRAVPCAPVSVDLTWLRDYQQEAVDATERAGRGILHVPTGGGKTEMAVALAQRLPCRWTFVVHRSNLMDQAAERWEKRTGERAGRIGEGAWIVERFTCATFQTLHAQLSSPKARELLAHTEGLIVDECHVLPAKTMWAVAQAFRSAYYRVGLSGTPLARGDRRSILAIAATGPVIYRIMPERLIAAGVLSKPRIRFLPVVQAPAGDTWSEVYGEAVVRSPVRNAVVIELARRATKPCLAFVKEIDHGRRLEKALRRAGVKVEFVWGTDSVEERKAAVRRLEHGDVEVLVCSVVFQEGVDIPSLRSVVVASGGRSVIAALQRIGRGMRVDAGKTEFEVWDVADRGHRWLERHTRARMRAYVSEGHETVVEQAGPLGQLALAWAEKNAEPDTRLAGGTGLG